MVVRTRGSWSSYMHRRYMIGHPWWFGTSKREVEVKCPQWKEGRRVAEVLPGPDIIFFIFCCISTDPLVICTSLEARTAASAEMWLVWVDDELSLINANLLFFSPPAHPHIRGTVGGRFISSLRRWTSGRSKCFVVSHQLVCNERGCLFCTGNDATIHTHTQTPGNKLNRVTQPDPTDIWSPVKISWRDTDVRMGRFLEAWQTARMSK